ncbi:MAG: hypothetical protein R2754_18775, partial [Microthrixaceae bacterium]
MTSDPAFVWVWLPGALEPVVGGRLDAVGDELRFTYGASYLKRSDAIPLEPETLALDAHTQRPPVGLDAHGVIRDAAPDAWGMRAILRRLAGKAADDTSALPLLTYLLEAGSNRIGALDVTRSPTEWTERVTQGTLTELFEASERLVSGRPLTHELHDALRYGTSVGG